MSEPQPAESHDDMIRRLTPADKLLIAQRLHETAWELAAAGVRLRRPELSEEEVQLHVRDIFLRATT
jgi:hypothetical protein